MGSDRRKFWGGALPLVSALTLSACAPIVEYVEEAPYLQLQNAPSPPTVTNLKIENGKGDVLYDGPRPDDGRIEARPTPAQLDGTLKISRSLSDGTVRDQTLTYEAGKPVKIEYDYVNNKYFVDTSNPPGTPKFYGRLTPNFEFRNRPDTAIIRREDNVSGRILDLIKADNSSSDPGFNGTVGLRFDQSFLGLGKKWGLELNGSYINTTSKESIGRLDSNGNRLAFFGPLGGGGAFTTNDITDLRYASNYWSWSIEPRLSNSYTVGEVLGEPLNLHGYVGFMYGDDEDDEFLDFDIPASNVRVSSLVKLDNRYYGPTFGFYTGWPILERLRLTTGAFGKVYVNELDMRRDISIVDGANLSGSDSLSRTQVTAGGGFNLGLNYQIAPKIVGRLGYEYEYADNTPAAEVNQDTGEATVHARSADVHRLSVGIRATW